MHATSVYIACEQFIRHQPVVCTLARSEDFCTRVVHVLLYTHVFMKFKSSCTVHTNLQYYMERMQHGCYTLQGCSSKLLASLHHPLQGAHNLLTIFSKKHTTLQRMYTSCKTIDSKDYSHSIFTVNVQTSLHDSYSN